MKILLPLSLAAYVRLHLHFFANLILLSDIPLQASASSGQAGQWCDGGRS